MQVQADFTYLAASAGRYITIKIYADGVLKYTANITSQEPVRLPAGFKAYNWEVEILGNVPVRSVAMASTMSELRGH